MVRNKWIRGWPWILMLLWWACTAHGAEQGPLVSTLPNGLAVVLQEDHSAPVVAIQYWVKAGSRTEKDSEAGITHLIEHMIFKGTPTRGVGEVAGEIESAGGEINAYTSFDYTVYHVSIASRYAGVGLDVLTDAVRNALFDAGELEQEKKVVLEELRMREDRPSGKLQKALFAKAYRVHPYRRPIIGYRERVHAFTRKDIQDYVHRLYVPENITLVMVGDLELHATLERIRGLLENWSPRPLWTPPLATEPSQERTRSVVLREPASEVHVQMGFRIPPVHHEDVPALDLLALILGMGESSRLEQRVRSQKGLVYSVGAYAHTPLESGLFLIHATLDPQHLKAALSEILKETFRIGGEGVPLAELEKARINVEADFLTSKETMHGKARNLGYFQTMFGDVHEEKAYLEAVRRLTPRDIKRVAREYLAPEQLTVALLIPEDAAVEIAPSDIEGTAREALEKLTPAAESPVVATQTARVHKEVMENGLTLLVKEDHAVPTVSIQTVFLGGSRFEHHEDAGVSAFLARLLTRGTWSRPAEQLALEVESMAGSLKGYSGRNSVGAAAEFLSRFFPQAMELLSDVLLNPTFDPEELKKERERLIAAVRREKDQPTRLAFQTFRHTLFRVHPYGFRELGTEDSLKTLTREDIQLFYHRVILPDNGVLAIVGDVTLSEALRWTRRYLGRWAGGGFHAPAVPKEPPLEATRSVRKTTPKQQVHIVLGFPGTTIGAPDKYPLEVLDTVLSGQGGRLFRELRDRQGLAYSVTSLSQVGLDPGFFGTYMGTSPENLDRAIDGLKAELRQVTQEKIRPEELERAKQYIVGRYEIGLQTHSAQAMTMALDERYDLGFDYGRRYIQRIQAVTREDVLQAARKYIHLDRYVLVIVGPES